jgi:hypothetical protein
LLSRPRGSLLLSRPKAQPGLTPEGVNKQYGTISNSAGARVGPRVATSDAAHGKMPSSANTAREIATMINATMANTGEGADGGERGWH